MRVLDAEYRDIHVHTEFSLKQLKQLRDFMDHASVSYDSEKEPQMPDADKYITEFLYPLICKLIEKYDPQEEGE